MQKGSIVRLKNTHAAIAMFIAYGVQMIPFPRPGENYVLSTDVTKFNCNKCNKLHDVAELEEIPGRRYNTELFDEIQAPGEVNISELIQEPEVVPV